MTEDTSENSDDVDPTNPNPGSYGHPDAEWYYVPEDLAQTISLGPVNGTNRGTDDWILGLSAAVPDEHSDEAEKCTSDSTRGHSMSYISRQKIYPPTKDKPDTVLNVNSVESRLTLMKHGRMVKGNRRTRIVGLTRIRNPCGGRMWPKDSDGYYTCPACGEKINTVQELQEAVQRNGVWFHSGCLDDYSSGS